MFDGVPVEQFHQFISTPSSTNSSFIQTPPISTSTNLNFLSFDPLLFPPPPLPTHHHHQTLFQSNHFVRTPAPTRCDQYNNAIEDKVADEEDIDIKDSSWSDDEVIQLLRIKSSSENWFRDFTWDHVSRKLAEMGYKRSAEKCKDKFEEETCRSFSNTIGYNKNSSSSSRYLISEEEHDIYINNNNAAAQNTTHHHHAVTIEPPAPGNVNHLLQEQPQVQEKKETGEEQNISEGLQGQKGHFDHKDPAEIEILMVQQPTQDEEDDDDSVQLMMTKSSKKRKRKHKRFKMVKGLCVDLVNKMMAQQEEMHKKLLDDMANRDEEKIKREEAWRKEEMERVTREIQIREQEQEMAKDRQSTITEFLNKITSLDQKLHIPFDIINFQDMIQTTCINKQPMPLSDQIITKQPSSDEKICIPELEDRLADQEDQRTSSVKDEIGKRWPREEVLALINIRSNVNNIGGNSELIHHHQDEYNNNNNIAAGNMNKLGGCSSSAGGSLWERISQGMLELGFKRSAKRCKEKWENINKYFRKTKDANKKRSLDSRTCPYYHELSKLYNQEKLPAASASNSTSLQPEKCLTDKISPENN